MDGPDTSQDLTHSSRAEAKLCLFIESLATCGIVTDAAKKAGFSREYAYEVKKKDQVFSMLWDDAIEQSTDMLEREARRRAVDGTQRKMFYRGVPVNDPETGKQYVEREYSDGLLTILLKAHRPDKFRDRTDIKHSGEISVPVVRIISPAGSAPLNEQGLMDKRADG